MNELIVIGITIGVGIITVLIADILNKASDTCLMDKMKKDKHCEYCIRKEKCRK